MRKVAFLPCHPHMWEGFETLWDKETSDPSNEVAVVPIPSYSRGCDDSLFNVSYITEGYPDSVRLFGVNDYNLATEHPDTIYIQSIEDADNSGFAVHPHFHTPNLRSFTDELVYVPYNCMPEIDPDNDHIDKYNEKILTQPGIHNVDRIIVQSENIKSIYLKLLAGQNNALREQWDKKISCSDYPRIRILEKYTKETVSYPAFWNSYLYKPDGSRKEAVLFTLSIVEMLKYNRSSFRKAKRIFEEYMEQKDDKILIWRPHKLLPDYIIKLRPELFEDFRTLLEFYINNNIGIFDETPTPTPAIILSDSMIDGECGLKELYKATGKPIISVAE